MVRFILFIFYGLVTQIILNFYGNTFMRRILHKICFILKGYFSSKLLGFKSYRQHREGGRGELSFDCIYKYLLTNFILITMFKRVLL